MPLFYNKGIERDSNVMYALETPGEGDGNSVVYFRKKLSSGEWGPWEAVWNLFAELEKQGVGRETVPVISVPLPPTTPPVAGRGRRRIPITKPDEGPFLNRGQAYWAQGVIIGADLYCFVGHQDGHPRFYKVHLPSGTVMSLGSLVSYRGTAEGWYWDAIGGLWLVDGPRLRRLNLFSTPRLDEVKLDISQTHPGCDLWQTHTSDDQGVHSATVRQIVADGAYPALGTVVSRWGVQTFYPADQYDLDESAVTTDGAYVLIKTKPDDDNLVVDLSTGEQRWLLKSQGALGHSDCGASCAVGADRANGTCALVDFRQPLGAGRPLYATWNMGHISVRGQTLLVSDQTYISKVAWDGSGYVTLWQHGQQGDPRDVDYQVQANLTPDGSWACVLVNGQLYALEIP